jgi:tetratricopeptide (TPR) repeat protein
MDDDIFFLKHRSVQQGLSGTWEIFSHGSMEKFDGTRGVQTYRPAYLLVFALEKQLFGEVPAVSHLINVLSYALLALLLFGLLETLFRGHHVLVAALTTLLYILHPLHTEVVASVKSRDEILAALFCLLAWRDYLSFIDHGKQDRRWRAVAWFLLASFTKESTIAFLAVYPLSAVMFRARAWKQVAVDMVPFVMVSLIYLSVRVGIEGTVNEYSGLPVLANVLTAAKDFSELMATKLEILWYNLKMVFVPWPLAWDYSYNRIPLVGFDSLLPWVALAGYGILLFAGIRYFRTRPLLAFGCWFFLLTSSPTNNFFINNTTTFGERLLFMPSLGACLVIVGLLLSAQRLRNKPDSAGHGGLVKPVAVIAVIFTVLTTVRAGDWKDNLRLFESGVEVNPESSRTQYSLASELFRQARKLPEGEKRSSYLSRAGDCFRRSIDILPGNFQARYNYALYSSFIGDTASAIREYKTIIALKPDYLEAINNLGVLYNAGKDFRNAYEYYKKAYDLNPDAPASRTNLAGMLFNEGLDFGIRGLADSALTSYRHCLEYDPSNVMAYNNIASIHAGRSSFDSCLFYLKRAYALDTRNMMVIENIGAVSYLAKDYAQGIEFAGRALQLNPGAMKSLNTMVNCYSALGRSGEAEQYRKQLSVYGTASH